MIHIPLEVYEENNLAAMFCPHCGCVLENKNDFNGDKPA
jgi:hypothetical protein